MIIKGYIDNFIFRNNENHYSVFALVTEDIEEGEIVCTGVAKGMEKGDYVELEGQMSEHPNYGPQFKMIKYKIIPPTDSISVERYLASGAIKGIGPALAVRIVKRFKDDTFRIMEEEPERLAEVKGISERKAREIAAQMAEKKDIRDAMLFLQEYGIGNSLAIRIYERYGIAMYTILKENPYRLAEDIKGVGFKTADEIAVRMGMANDSPERMEGGLLYCLQVAATEGNTYLPKEELLRRTSELLETNEDNLVIPLSNLALENRLIVKAGNEGEKVYLKYFYYAELVCAYKLQELTDAYANVSLTETEEESCLQTIAKIEKEQDAELDELQRNAVLACVTNGVFILTGGPGTGKTTTIRTMIEYFVRKRCDVMLAAPTGRAAKRMEEATGYEAKTIHRLLEVSGAPDGDEERPRFNRNEYNPLEADVIIVDEMSMVDIYLFHALLMAVSPGTKLIMAGDANQLPSVGPGNILKDLLKSAAFPIVKLEKIYRQNLESDIILNAHKINRGEEISFQNDSKDFFFLERKDIPLIYRDTVLLVRDKTPRYLDVKPFEIQVLTPMRKGNLGVENLNRILQEQLNPPTPEKREVQRGEIIFRTGDKVMQIKNNYETKWVIRGRNGIKVDEGEGVFNGDVGRIVCVDTYTKNVTVLFEDQRQVEYPFTQLEELELSYAITIHKSQGSEYPAVILPLLDGPRMLLNRNLLYTAVTRATRCVVILGSSETLKQMIRRGEEQKRYTDLSNRIKEVSIDSFLEENRNMV